MIKRFCLIIAAVLIALPALTSCASRAQPVPQPEPMSPPAAVSSEPEPVPMPEPEPIPEPEPEPVGFTLVAVGDLMAHWDQIEDALTPDGDYDFSHSFAPVAGDLGQGYALGNLETVFGGPERGYSSYPRFSTPDAYGVALKENGLDFVSTCNNHSLDMGVDGVLRTLERLDEIGLAHTGTYASAEEAEAITVVETPEGIRIAILAFTFSTNGIPVPADKPWLINMLTESKVKEDLSKARALDPDLIVVMPHMGNEYETYTREIFLEWMDLMLYHGADVVLASHPHVLQPMLMRELTDVAGVSRTGFIICSLGNFISVQRDEPMDMGVILKIEFIKPVEQRPVIERVSFVPIWVAYSDNTGKRSIRVVPVGDALSGLDGDNLLGINSWNADRLWRANSEITAMYLGAAVPRDKLEREYTFYARNAGDIAISDWSRH